MARINRTGKVNFGDASLNIWEDGLGGTLQERDAWEKAFKRQVFKRIIQQLNRLGWKLVIPADKIERFGRRFAEGRRYCVKGDLKADLDVSGRCIQLKMFQSVNAPDRPDNDGRYQSGKERHMPYVMLLEMERTRRKIRDYLCNVFSGYEFNPDTQTGRTSRCGPGYLTNLEWLDKQYKESWHFKGDLATYVISDYNRKSADGAMLEHKQRVWFYDRKGRVQTGIAYYNINNMWWVIWGRYGHTNVASFDLFTVMPENCRRKRNNDLRTKKLKRLLNEVVAVMNFEKAAVLRDLLYPDGHGIAEAAND